MRAHPIVVPFQPRRRRRDEVVQRVSRLSRRPDAGDAEQWARGVRDAVEDLGPLFASFGAYLGSRIDLLPAGDCVELVRCAAPPLPAERVYAVLSRELGQAAVALRDVDPAPIASSALTQAHRALLTNGDAVRVDVLMTTAQEWSEDVDLLPLLQPVFDGHIAAGTLLSAIADFGVRLQQEEDFAARRTLLETAGHERADIAALVFPRPIAELCGQRVLVTEVPPEASIPDDNYESRGDADTRTALSMWLRQALFGEVVPVLVPGGRIAVRGNRLVAPPRLARLPPSCQQHLLAHLFAVAGDMPDRSWTALEPELRPAVGAAPAEDVQRAFRRLVPFRDDKTCHSGSVVADHAFLQWRLATAHGWLPAPHLVPFYQGLLALLGSARRAAETGDVLADVLGELRWTAGVRQLDALAGDADMMMAMERQMALLMELPQKLDRLLSVAADGSVRVQLVTADAIASRRNRPAAIVAALLVVAAFVALASSSSLVRQLWGSEPLGSLVLVATGAALVWAVGRFR